VARLLEADGKYDEAWQFFSQCGDNVKSAQCALKLIRTSLLDESFLLSKEVDRKAIGVLNDSCGVLADGVSMSREENESIQFEISLLKGHSLIKIYDLHHLIRRAEASSNPLRLMIIAMRLWLRNAESRGLKNDQKGQGVSLIPWQPLCEAMSELNKAVQTCLQQLRYMTTSYSTSPQAADIIIRQCEELFEFSRNVNVSGVRGLFVEDIPATALLWPRTTKPPAKIKSTSDAKNIMGEYNKMSAPHRSSVQIESRYEIDIKTFAVQAIIFLESRVLLGARSLLFRELTRHLALSLIPSQTRYSRFKVTLDSSTKTPQEVDTTSSTQLLLLDHAYRYGKEISSLELIDLCRTHYLDLALPLLPSLENMEEISKFRQSLSFQDALKSRFISDELGKIGFEYVVQGLLIAELQHDIDTHLFADLLKDKMRFIRNWKGVYNARELCEGFAWEASSSSTNIITALTPDEIKTRMQNTNWKEDREKSNILLQEMYKNEDHFLKSLKIGEIFLTQDWDYEWAPLYNDERCLSPASFIALAEKYIVLALLYSRKCENVLLPKSLTFDVLSRQNEAYGNMVWLCMYVCMNTYIYKYIRMHE
jgi:hypothetical protein